MLGYTGRMSEGRAIRSEIRDLVALGPFPSAENVDLATIKRQQELLQCIHAPVTDDESRALVRLFGPDDYFGLAWTVLHLIELAPGWPLWDCLSDSNEWNARLQSRAARGNLGLD